MDFNTHSISPILTTQLPQSNFRDTNTANKGSLLDHNTGHPRCLSACTNQSEPAEIPSLHGRRTTILLPGTTLRALDCPESVYSNYEMAPTALTPKKCTNNRIFGRPIGLVPMQEPNDICDKYRYWTPSGTRIPVELREINNNTISEVQLAGDIVVHTNGNLVHPSGETAHDKTTSNAVVPEQGI